MCKCHSLPLLLYHGDLPFFFKETLNLSLGFFLLPVTLPIDMASHGLSPAVFGSVMAVNRVVIEQARPTGTRHQGFEQS